MNKKDSTILNIPVIMKNIKHFSNKITSFNNNIKQFNNNIKRSTTVLKDLSYNDFIYNLYTSINDIQENKPLDQIFSNNHTNIYFGFILIIISILLIPLIL